jgi:hypothetical protein
MKAFDDLGKPTWRRRELVHDPKIGLASWCWPQVGEAAEGYYGLRAKQYSFASFVVNRCALRV